MCHKKQTIKLKKCKQTPKYATESVPKISYIFEIVAHISSQIVPIIVTSLELK